MKYRDAFSKREQADENLYVRQKEQEKLQELKKKIADHQKHLEELDKHVYVLNRLPIDTDDTRILKYLCRTDQMSSGSKK